MAFFVDKSFLLVIITLEHLTIYKEGFMSKPKKPSFKEKMKKMKEMLSDIEKRKRAKKRGVPYMFSCSAGDRS
jgi:predicted SprT family Zn-dependent metalloprotease